MHWITNLLPGWHGIWTSEHCWTEKYFWKTRHLWEKKCFLQPPFIRWSFSLVSNCTITKGDNFILILFPLISKISLFVLKCQTYTRDCGWVSLRLPFNNLLSFWWWISWGSNYPFVQAKPSNCWPQILGEFIISHVGLNLMWCFILTLQVLFFLNCVNLIFLDSIQWIKS